MVKVFGIWAVTAARGGERGLEWTAVGKRAAGVSKKRVERKVGG